MKKLLLSLTTTLGFISIATSQCTDIFISEYVEGTFNNKAIEIYNPTSATINLSAYKLVRYSNGGTAAGPDKNLQLGGTIAAKSTYVIVLDRRDPNATGADEAVWDCLQAKADTFMSSNYNVNNVMNFNGNDVLAIVKNGSTLIDFFGVLGQDPAPGNASGNAAWPDSNATGGLTIDNTLIRKESITVGVTTAVALATNPNADFNPRIQWYSAGRNRFNNLGSHDCSCDNANVTVIDTVYACNAAGIDEIAEVNFSIYPNPSNTGSINISAEKTPVGIRVFNVLGTVVYETKSNRNNTPSINTNGWIKGLYFISLQFENGKESTKKVTIN